MYPDYLRSARVSQAPGPFSVVRQCIRQTRAACHKAVQSISPTVAIILTVFGAIAGVTLCLRVFTPNFSAPPSLAFGKKGYGVQRTAPCTLTNPCRFKIVADLDHLSKVPGGKSKSPEFQSYLNSGWLWIEKDKASVEWLTEEEIIKTSFNEAGRGMELSELARFNGKLYSFDDRTGIVFDLSGGKAIPAHIVMEGDGNVAKGMKIEWATVKNDKLWMGSFGKEFTTADGTKIVHQNPLWVATLDLNGKIEHVDWSIPYGVVRSVLKVNFPGYAIHEAVCWSSYKRRWVFLPRRVSKTAYDEISDEEKGSNKMVTCDEAFVKCTVTEVTTQRSRRGFSSFKFLPGSNDQVIVALKSEENAAEDTQQSYITIFTWDGRVLLDEVPIPNNHKFEGIEFEDG